MSNTVYATHRIVRGLEQNLGESVSRLNETAAGLEVRVQQTEGQNLRLQGMIEENQIKLDRLQARLDEFSTAVYKALNLTPPTRSGFSAGPDRNVYVPDDAVRITDPGAGTSTPARVSAPPRQPVAARPTAPTTPPSQPLPPTAPVSQGADAMTDYQGAQRFFIDQEFTQALAAYEAYLTRYPNSKFTSNAQFWKAECLLKLERYSEAASEYDVLRAQFADSDKVPASYYRQALCYIRLGQRQQAVGALETVIREYPATAAATQSEDLLRRMQQQGG
jgi:tol-pal system protein YbgF